ncbi:MAG: M18 family aminopeptidase [Spirochaetaceae bacterium 4572_59]|nr:MAG: M18 family aminopeptidase [Spirochaetaceae bacterium 4572_59]
MKNRNINDLLDYLDRSPSPYHAVAESAVRLKKNGWQELSEQDSWDLQADTGYYVIRNGSSLLAFNTGKLMPSFTGFRIITAHTDSPAFRLKSGKLKESQGVYKTGIEVLGGPILSTWLDRDLSLAGRVVVKTEKGIESRLYRKDDASVMIPNPAIHLNRELNQGFEYNPQSQLSLLITASGGDKLQSVHQLIAKEVNLEEDAILDADIIAYDTQKASLTGWNKEYFSSGRIDNLATCHAALEAAVSVSGQDAVTLTALFDNEEIGSRTPHGADSAFLEHVMERIVLASGGIREDYLRSCPASFMISADGAHAVHPNFAKLHDEAYAPVLNGGPVLKVNANWNYSTTGETAAQFRLLCRGAGVNCQSYLNRSDLRGGKSLGPIAASRMGIPSVDVGNPMWSMHSIRETAGVSDHQDMISVLQCHLRQSGK